MVELERVNDNLFKVSYKGLEYWYACKLNALRPVVGGEEFTPEELSAPHHPYTPFIPQDWDLNESVITIGVTSTCNLHCSYCHVAGGDYQDALTEPMVGNIKRQLAKALAKKAPRSVLKISFHSDGESMSRPEVMKSIMDFVDAVKGNVRSYFSLVSNGTLINDSNIDFVKRMNVVQISMDGIPELHDQDRGSSELTIRGIRTLMTAKVGFHIRSTITPKTLSTVKEFLDFLADLVQPHADQPLGVGLGLVYQGEREIQDEMYIAPEVFLQAYLEAKAYGKTKNIDVFSPLEHASYPGNGFCSANGGTIFTASGLVTSCTRVTREENANADTFIYGKFNPITLEYDIDNEKYRALGKLQEVPEDCEKCPALMLCGGSTCYLEKGPTHCAVRSKLLILERLRLGGVEV
jgi:radical SAM protein with 4Fe4S-binding SPASM domain